MQRMEVTALSVHNCIIFFHLSNCPIIETAAVFFLFPPLPWNQITHTGKATIVGIYRVRKIIRLAALQNFPILAITFLFIFVILFCSVVFVKGEVE